MEQFESVEVVRARCAAERAAFVAVGRRVAVASDPLLKVRLAEVSRHHAWRAEQWASLLAPPFPEGDGAPGPWPAEGASVEVPDGDDDASVTAWLDALLDDFITATEWVSRGCHAASDGPVRRVAHRVLADLRLDQPG